MNPQIFGINLCYWSQIGTPKRPEYQTLRFLKGQFGSKMTKIISKTNNRELSWVQVHRHTDQDYELFTCNFMATIFHYNLSTGCFCSGNMIESSTCYFESPSCSCDDACV